MELRDAFSRCRTLELVPKGQIETYELVEPERVLGVSIPYIYKAYVQLQPIDWTQVSEQQVLPSLISLVATNEHLSAINMRKKLIEAQILSPEEDLHCLDVLLSSHNAKHNKSPMLWQHRRWLLSNHFKPQGKVDIDRELNIIEQAAKNHFMNYYAWAYARWLIDNDYARASQLLEWTWGLCYFNISDTSMWSFLARIDVNGQHADSACELWNRYDRPAIAGYLQSLSKNKERNNIE